MNPVHFVRIGHLVAIVLAVTGWRATQSGCSSVIGASFGPVCGAMAADYLLAGSGPVPGRLQSGRLDLLARRFAVGAADFIPRSWPAK